MAFPLFPIGRVSGDYHRYAIHHTHYSGDYQGRERFRLDVLALSPQAHWFVHSVLGGSKRARHQKHKYPNTQQRLFHLWCRLPLLLKLFVMWLGVGAIALASITALS